jgi:hypothetical protein
MTIFFFFNSLVENFHDSPVPQSFRFFKLKKKKLCLTKFGTIIVGNLTVVYETKRCSREWRCWRLRLLFFLFTRCFVFCLQMYCILFVVLLLSKTANSALLSYFIGRLIFFFPNLRAVAFLLWFVSQQS